jgi:hypothetical protein
MSMRFRPEVQEVPRAERLGNEGGHPMSEYSERIEALAGRVGSAKEYL